ncbi:MAG: hypothetical protein ABR549_15295 [Mycobacteriales bacterium]
MRLRLLLLLLAAAAVLGTPSTATAAGTGGIEVTPDPGVIDGRQVTAFHVEVPSRGKVTVPFFLRNTTARTVTGRLYAASATRDAKGQFAIGAPASAKGVGLPNAMVTLAPRETRHLTFSVAGPVHGTEYRAVVVEVQRGAITERAATLVYLERGRRVPVPLLLAGIGGALVLAAGAGLLVARRRTARRSLSGG